MKTIGETPTKLQFNDADTYIWSSADGKLDLASDGETKLVAGGDIVLEADGGLKLRIDTGSNTTEIIGFYQAAEERAKIDESGNLQIDGQITIGEANGGTTIVDTDASNVTITKATTNLSGALKVGGGYNSTGTTISDAGVFETNGAGTFGGIVTGTGFTAGSAVLEEDELEILDLATVTTAELNIMDGSATTQALVVLEATDGVVISDADVMKQALVSDFATYVATSTNTLTNKTLTAPKIVDAGFIADANGNEAIIFQTTASAVNELELTNAATGNGVQLATTGGDNDVDLLLVAKGAGVVKADGVEVVTLTGSQTLTNKTLTAPNLDTPTALVGTNITGTASGFTAGNVTTNANLTGDVTSSGNAASIAAGVIVDADINGSAAITATKIANGSVTSAEFQYIGGLTSDAQAQLDALDVRIDNLGGRSESSSSSDMRFKKNISTVSGALEKLSKLNPVNYDWRKDEFKNKGFDDKKQWGFVAQEVEEVMPELVGTDEDDYLTLNYNGFVPLLTKAMQEQQDEIENQQKEIDELKAQLEMIMKMMQSDMSDKTDNKKAENNQKPVKLSMATVK